MVTSLQLIPQILAAVQNRMTIDYHYWKVERAQHEERMATDPEYARAYELRQAEDEAESYWMALYDNQLPEYEEDEL